VRAPFGAPKRRRFKPVSASLRLSQTLAAGLTYKRPGQQHALGVRASDPAAAASSQPAQREFGAGQDMAYTRS